MRNRPFRVLMLVVGLAVGCTGCATAPIPATTIVFTADTAGTLTASRLDQVSGERIPVASVAAGEPLEFLALHPRGHLVYALGRQRLHTYAFDAAAGTLQRRGEVAAGTRGTHLEIDRGGSCLFLASYGEHLLAAVPLDDQGLPTAAPAPIGGAADPQWCRNAHQTRVDPRNRFVYVPCLGSNHIAVLAFDGRNGLRPQAPAATGSGTGPRHLDFHPGGEVLYVLNELQSSVGMFRIDADTGALALAETVSTLPAGVTEGSRSSDIQVRPDGRFVYAINREPRNEVVVLAIAADGTLQPHSATATGGVHARSCALDDTGSWLLVANVRSSDLSTFRVLPTGGLQLVSRQPTAAGVMSVRVRSY